MSEQGMESRHHHRLGGAQEPPPPPHQYGTFHQPAVGFPQPVPPPGVAGSPSEHYSGGYQAIPVYEGDEQRRAREGRLPCCGCGIGWFLFIVGFFLAAIPWYVGAFILFCTRVDPREKPGYITCTIAAVLATIALVFGLVHL